MKRIFLIIILVLKIGAFESLLAQENKFVAEWEETNKKALSLYNKGKFAEAVKTNLLAVSQAETSSDNFLVAASLHQKARAESYLDLEAADSDYKKAFWILKPLPESRRKAALVGYIYNDWSIVKWFKRRDLGNTMAYIQKARAIGVSQKDDRLLACSSLQIGKIYYWQQKTLASIVWLEKARLLTDVQEVEVNSEISEFLYKNYLKIGRFQNAASELEVMKRLLSTNNTYISAKLKLAGMESDFFNTFGQPDKAILIKKSGAALARQNNNKFYELSFKTGIALTWLSLGRSDREVESYVAFINRESEIGDNSDGNFENIKYIAKISRATLLAYEQKKSQSETVFSEVEKLRKIDDWQQEMRSLGWQARVATFQKDWLKLKTAGERKLLLATKQGAVESLPGVYTDLALAAAGLKDIPNAKEYLSKAIALSEEKRQTNDPLLAIGAVQELNEAYRLQIEISLSENLVEKAFSEADNFKAKYLKDKLLNNNFPPLAPIETALKNETFELSLKTIENPGEKIALEKLEFLEGDFAAANRRAEKGEAEDAKPPGGDIIGELNRSRTIPAGAAIVSYLFSGGKLTAFVWERNKPVRAVTLPVTREELENKFLYRFYLQVENNLISPDTMGQLYRLLYEPLALGDGVKQLILIPDGALNQIPFQILIDEKGKYLVESTIISYAPSVRVLLDSLKNPKPQRVTVSTFSNTNYKKLKFPKTRLESEFVSTIFGGRNFFEATETDFKQNASKTDMIHFATHGEVDFESPLDSFVALKAFGSDDGRVTVGELLRYKFKPRSQIFFSSCETNTGQNYGGEGVLSLSYGALFAGASTVVSANWKVADNVMFLVASAYYANLKKGLPAAEALQKATVAVMTKQEKTALQNWGAFSLIGDFR